jgi:hypothetical protein
MFYEVNRTTSLGDDTFVSSATMRAHVRAIDSSEDSLLRTYRDAAVDYLQNLSDRVLGLSTAKVLLDYNEFRAPFRIQKLQGITSVDKIEYLKDGAFTIYTPDLPDDIVHGHHTSVGLTFSGATATNRVIEVNTASTTIDATFTAVDVDSSIIAYWNLYKYNFTSKQYVLVESVADGAPVGANNTFENLDVGLYQVEFSSQSSTDGHAHSSYSYFAISNGTLFKQTALYEQYPAQFDLSELCNLVDCDDGTMFRIRMSCGTDWSGLPMQYTQAALLLIGHYYNMREAEAIGGVTAEVKEGVHRLIASVRQY